MEPYEISFFRILERAKVAYMKSDEIDSETETRAELAKIIGSSFILAANLEANDLVNTPGRPQHREMIKEFKKWLDAFKEEILERKKNEYELYRNKYMA